MARHCHMTNVRWRLLLRKAAWSVGCKPLLNDRTAGGFGLNLTPRRCVIARAELLVALICWWILPSASRLKRPCANQRRSEEHTSELQSLAYLVCRLLLEKKKKIK